jgi:hypothetical protein
MSAAAWTPISYRVILGYSDLAGRWYHSVVRLQDPNHGQRTDHDRDPHSTESPTQPLHARGTEVGEGAAPPPQWRVTFAGPPLSDDDKTKLRANAMLHTGGHGLPGGNWSLSVIVSAERATNAIERVRDALGPDTRYVGYAVEPWESGRFSLEAWSRRRRFAGWITRPIRRARDRWLRRSIGSGH